MWAVKQHLINSLVASVTVTQCRIYQSFSFKMKVQYHNLNQAHILHSVLFGPIQTAKLCSLTKLGLGDDSLSQFCNVLVRLLARKSAFSLPTIAT